MGNIYKVLTEEEWQLSYSSGYIMTDLDERDGFIHFSSSTQLLSLIHI